ncbi:MAG: hypothetical protein FJZ95_06660 [Chloroflexi bacterium]|nr:hypothetical protein [Chloroflexota bacterium]
MKQLSLPLQTINCRHYNECEAPLCPQDINLKGCLWFPSEPVCRLKDAPTWVQKQRQIAKVRGIDREKYFTLRMLNSIEEITQGLEGANPQSSRGERDWFGERTESGKSRAEVVNPPSEECARNYRLF